MHKTKNDLPLKARKEISTILNARLADAIDLQHQAKQAHWNVRGPNFIALHKLFDEVFEATEEAVDLIAERIVQLGGTAEGSIQTVAKRSELKAYPSAISTECEHVEALATALASFGTRVRRAIDQAEELHDKGTADLFTEVSRSTDKYLWFLEAHLG